MKIYDEIKFVAVEIKTKTQTPTKTSKRNQFKTMLNEAKLIKFEHVWVRGSHMVRSNALWIMVIWDPPPIPHLWTDWLTVKQSENITFPQLR